MVISAITLTADRPFSTIPKKCPDSWARQNTAAFYVLSAHRRRLVMRFNNSWPSVWFKKMKQLSLCLLYLLIKHPNLCLTQHVSLNLIVSEMFSRSVRHLSGRRFIADRVDLRFCCFFLFWSFKKLVDPSHTVCYLKNIGLRHQTEGSASHRLFPPGASEGQCSLHSYVPSLQDHAPRVFLINNSELRFRFWERNDRWTFGTWKSIQ